MLEKILMHEKVQHIVVLNRQCSLLAQIHGEIMNKAPPMTTTRASQYTCQEAPTPVYELPVYGDANFDATLMRAFTR